MTRAMMMEDHLAVALKILMQGDGLNRLDFLEELIDMAEYHLC